MDQSITLDRLAPGEPARIAYNRARDGLRRRLTDLGFVPGGEIRCLYRAAGGDPTAYRVRGAVIALRREDAGRIAVRRPGADEAWR